MGNSAIELTEIVSITRLDAVNKDHSSLEVPP